MDPTTPVQPLTPPENQASPAPPTPLVPGVPPAPAVPEVPTPAPESAVESDVRSQIVEHIKNGKNVLVTVGNNPSVDELASALALTLMLEKLDKHVTSVFSGDVPPAIEFLDPEATFENSVDSLRDFIIALSKEKADKLRYKVEDNVVKIFITPYKTILSQDDLEFSQGDFNVDIILALGVEKSEELDKAIAAHGKILHDAAVATINAGHQKSDLGAVNWNDTNASSIAEMLVGLSEQLGTELLDEEVSTALLTGIVAETNRFSNEKTTPKVMTLSAQLMAAGANQQLVATNLRQEGMISEPVRTKNEDQPHDDEGEMTLEHEDDAKDKTEPATKKAAKPRAKSAKEDAVAKPETKVDKEDTNVAPKPVLKSADDSAESTSEVEPVESVEPTDSPTEVKEAVSSEDNDSTKSTQPPTPDLPPLPSVELEAPAVLNHEPQGGERVIEPLSTETTQDATPLPTPTSADASLPPLPSLPELPSVQNAPTADTSVPPLPSIEPTEPHTLAEEPRFGGTLNATGEAALEADQAALEEARQAVEAVDAAPPPTIAPPPTDEEPAPPASPITDAINPEPSTHQDSAQPLAFTAPPLSFDAAPAAEDSNAHSEEETPVDAFMQPHNDGMQPPDLNALTPPTPSPAAMNSGDLPPLPPMPSVQGDGTMPPLPPVPGQATTDPSAALQPQINPAFMQDMPQSQNSWSQAGDDLAAQQAEKADQRQARMDEMNQQYDQAVDRNRELQGLPPVNNPNGTGLPPVPPSPSI